MRHCYLFFTLLISTMALSTCQTVMADPIRIMPLGDSITRGSVPGGYRTRLYNRLTDELYPVNFVGSADDNPDPGNLADPDHEGHGGWRIDEIAANIETYLRTTSPAVVLMHLGTNDVAQDYNLATAPDRLNSLLDDISAISPNTHVIVAQIITSTSATEAAQIDAYNAAIPTIVTNQQAAGHSVTMVDMNSVVSTDQFADRYHPNDAGYDALADAWFSAIQSLGTVTNPVVSPSPPPAGSRGSLRNTSFDQIYTDADLASPVTSLTPNSGYYFSTDADTNVLTGGGAGTGPFPMYVSGWYTEQSNSDKYSVIIDTHNTTPYFNAGETDGAYFAVRIVELADNRRTVRQYLDQTFAANTDYTLSVDVGHRKDLTFPTLDGVVVELLAGDTVLATSDSVTPLPGAGNFETWTFAFGADDLLADYSDFFGQYLSIRLGTQLVGSTADTWVFFDNVTFESTAAPEPATMAMLGMGGAMMLVRRRRQQ